jgi:hypothetical protein
VIDERPIDDLLGEALRRHRHGLMRPLWRDMPENNKVYWRQRGARMLGTSAERDEIIRSVRAYRHHALWSDLAGWQDAKIREFEPFVNALLNRICDSLAAPRTQDNPEARRV